MKPGQIYFFAFFFRSASSQLPDFSPDGCKAHFEENPAVRWEHGKDSSILLKVLGT